ncbi:MAG TPA: biopolymer transporter ExbD [Pontiellaceae bacterium]|nr:biopolymer transporter ExbD [Pontiellaceae bacterium]
MKAWLEELSNDKMKLQLVPLIDCVFVLLIYFMVCCTLVRPEADLSLSLPGQVKQTETVVMPDEQVIEVRSDGTIILNDQQYANDSKADTAALEQTLIRYREASSLLDVQPLITISADKDSVHGRVVDVLNACAGAGIKNVTFANVE